MYSTEVPEISNEPFEFGTSGLLYRSNKLMYDRVTGTLWRQFTGEPVVGPLVGSGIKLERFPVVVTTWAAWLAQHPRTTVLSAETGVYDSSSYAPESDSQSIYYDYRANPGTMFPVWVQSDAVAPKEEVLGVLLGSDARAYVLGELTTPVINDAIGGTPVVVVVEPGGSGGRAYLRGEAEFEEDFLERGSGPPILRDRTGREWAATEESLSPVGGSDARLARLPSHSAFWFGWYASYPQTSLYESSPAN